MATHIFNKKKEHSIRNNLEGSSTMNEAENLGGIITVSESDSAMTRCNRRKSKASNKGHPTKSKTTQNAFGASRVDNIRKIKSISSDIIISPPFFANESNAEHNGMTKERMKVKNTAKFLIPKRKNTNHKSSVSSSKQGKKLTTSNFSNRKPFSDNALKSVDDWCTRFNSLMDLRKGNNENNDTIFSRAYFRQNVFSVSSSEALNFDGANPNRPKIPFDYLREFDLVRYGDLPRNLDKHYENKNVFSLVPRISPFVPVTLPKKKYSHGILLIKDSKIVTEANDEKDLNEATLRIEIENEDALHSCSDSESKPCPEDDKCLNNCQLRNDDDYVSFEKPIRIKLVDEASDKVRDIVIYSEDFLKDLMKEKEKFASKKEICERIILESTDYKGKSLKIITSAEKYYPIPNSNMKSRGHIKSSTVKAPDKTPKKYSNHTQVKKKKSDIHSSNKNSKVSQSSEQVKKRTLTDQNTSSKNNDKIDIKSVVISFTEINETFDRVENKNRSKRMKIVKREYKDFESRNESKTRTALKNINFEHIIASSFSYYFQFFAKLGHPIKNGTVISKKNSTKWLKKCGIIQDSESKSMTEKCFMNVAKAKCVLNIYDYIKCLNKIARNRQMLLVDLLHKMMSVDLQCVKKSNVKQEENCLDESSTGQDLVPETTETRSHEICI